MLGSQLEPDTRDVVSGVKIRNICIQNMRKTKLYAEMYGHIQKLLNTLNGEHIHLLFFLKKRYIGVRCSSSICF